MQLNSSNLEKAQAEHMDNTNVFLDEMLVSRLRGEEKKEGRKHVSARRYFYLSPLSTYFQSFRRHSSTS
jgi:hypothetical protein